MTMFITLEELKAYLKISNTQSDELLTSSIKQATSFIQDYTWRKLTATDYTYIIDWRWENAVILQDKPANSITSFEYNSWTISSPIWEAYNEDGYWLNKEEWIIRTLFNIKKGVQNNKIVYNAWYINLPEDIKRCTIRIATFFFSWAWKIKQGVKKESVDWASIEYDTTTQAIESEIYGILDKYKIISI